MNVVGGEEQFVMRCGSSWVGLALLCCLPLGGGCVAFYSHADVPVTVRDAETGDPVEQAAVDVWYRYRHVLNAPSPPVGIATDEGGAARVSAADFGDFQIWSVTADGYIPFEQVLPERPDQWVVPLYRKPAPRVTIVVPDEYAGPVLIDVRRGGAEAAASPGKREFTFEASADGYVRIDAADLLWRYFRANGWHDWPRRPDHRGSLRIHAGDRPVPPGEAALFLDVAARYAGTYGGTDDRLRIVYVLGSRERYDAFRALSRDEVVAMFDHATGEID